MLNSQEGGFGWSEGFEVNVLYGNTDPANAMGWIYINVLLRLGQS